MDRVYTVKNAIKTFVKTAIAFLAVTLAVEVSILITTKVTGWDSSVNGRPWAVAAHVHLIVLGALWFFVLALLEKNFGLSAQKLAKPAYIVFLAGLGAVVALILYKGFNQLAGGTLIRGLAEGGAAIAHTALFVGFFLWAYVIWKSVSADKSESKKDQAE